MGRYNYIVSLGYFCSPAMEFERIDKRQFSLPFDWLITPKISDVIDLINNGFEDFLNEEYMYQIIDFPQFYRNVKYDIDYYHDFSPFKNFDSQISGVLKKYGRRIERFYSIIKKPTLFLRYINERDTKYISENYDYILQSLRKHNPQNDIIFVANNDISLNVEAGIKVYYVEKDKNDSVARTFLKSNDDLLDYIMSNVDASATQKVKYKNKHIVMLKKCLVKAMVKLKLVYRHSKQC